MYPFLYPIRHLLSLCFLAALLLAPGSARALSDSIVISQVYGGGGNSGATYTHDFVELFNRGGAPASIDGWTLQYTSASGATWQTAGLSGVIQPGGYYLVQLAQGSGGTTPLPAPDASASIAMSGSSGKVALVSAAAALSGSCPEGAQIVDLVGYGSAACFEGSGPAPAPSNTTSGQRAEGGCRDTDDNGADFSAGPPVPRNSASPAAPCLLSSDPTGSGAASPNPATAGEAVLLSVVVTPGANPTSSGLAVAGDLSALGGPADQPFYDDGSSGDPTPGDGEFSYLTAVPAGWAAGEYSLPVRISDAQGRSADLLIRLEVVPSGANSPPAVGAGGPYGVLEGQTITLTASGSDPDGDALSYAWDLDHDGFFETPGQVVAFNAGGIDGPDSQPIQVQARDPGGLAATAQAVVHVLNADPALSVMPPLQSAQYSDPLADVSITGSDQPGDLLPAISARWSFDGGVFTDGLPAWLQLDAQGCEAAACSWHLSGRALAAPGIYLVRLTLADKDGGSGTADIRISLFPEDARATYSGALFAATSSPSSSTAVLNLAATVEDISAFDPLGDPDPGDIRNAIVRFVDRDNGDAVLCTAPIGLVDPADLQTGTAACSWTVDLGSSDSFSVRIGTEVAGHYQRSSPGDDAVLTVSRPLANSFITGGGYLVLESSAGMLAGDPGSKANFGFNVGYKKAGRGLKGQFTLIVRRTEADGLHVYQVRASQMTSLAVQSEAGAATAAFHARAVIQDITDPAAPIPIDGNASLQVTMLDDGAPGTGDTIGFSLWSKSGGLWFSSGWNGQQTVEQALGGGNLYAR